MTSFSRCFTAEEKNSRRKNFLHVFHKTSRVQRILLKVSLFCHSNFEANLSGKSMTVFSVLLVLWLGLPWLQSVARRKSTAISANRANLADLQRIKTHCGSVRRYSAPIVLFHTVFAVSEEENRADQFRFSRSLRGTKAAERLLCFRASSLFAQRSGLSED
jgi:hypothetical protein